MVILFYPTYVRVRVRVRLGTGVVATMSDGLRLGVRVGRVRGLGFHIRVRV